MRDLKLCLGCWVVDGGVMKRRRFVFIVPVCVRYHSCQMAGVSGIFRQKHDERPKESWWKNRLPVPHLVVFKPQKTAIF